MNQPIDLHSEDGRERIAQLFRYAQVGACVNGVTHEINNLLGAIMAYADLLSLNPNLTADGLRMLEQINSAVQKSTSLIGTLTGIARKEKPDASMIDVPEVIDRILDLRRYDFRVAQVALDVELDNGLPSMVVDLPRFQLALLYLLANAFDAAQEAPSKRVRVQARVAGDAVEILVWNSGPVVAENERALIFDPFFTTKPDGRVGLGLTLAREIARLHDGGLEYDPERGFVMRLPRQNSLARRA